MNTYVSQSVTAKNQDHRGEVRRGGGGRIATLSSSEMWVEMGLNFSVGEDTQYHQLTNLSEHVSQSVSANEQERG